MVVKTAYKNIFFDLDQTLWDFKSNSELVLKSLCKDRFSKEIANPQEFLDVYYPINDQLWALYRDRKIVKSVLRIKRFEDSLAHFGIHDKKQVEQFCEDYLIEAPKQTILVPHTIEVLEYLKAKNYRLFLLTNGFKEVQDVKIKVNNLEQYFEKMITSDEVGYQKPHRKIFEFALKSVNARKVESIMIGDDINTDIEGAIKFGMDSVYFNVEGKIHDKKPTHECSSLLFLKDIL